MKTRLEELSSDFVIYDDETDNGDCVAIIPKTDDEDYDAEVVRKNARLFAAAPQMLKALNNWGRDHTSPLQPNSPHDLLVAAVHAIEAAEGDA